MSEDLTREIIVAAENGEYEIVKNAIRQGADANAMGPNSGALHVAAFNGHDKIVSLLLENGADPNVADKQAFFPLHLAASKGYTSICTMLIKKGANLECKTEKNGTALHVAAASNFSGTLKSLLKSGANLDPKDIFGMTPLSAACAQGNIDCVKALLKANADVNIKNNYDESPLQKAIERLAATRLSGWNTEGTNNGKAVKYTIEKGAFRYFDGNVDPKDPYNLGKIMSIKDQKYCASQSWGPAQHIPYLQAFDTIKALLKVNPELNTISKLGQSAMWWACVAGDAKIIKELHKAGANFDAVENNGVLVGVTCLHKAASSGRMDGLEMYLKLNKDIDINIQDKYGWTPLHHLADLGGHKAMADILLAKGAEKHAKSTKELEDFPIGMTPSDLAYHWKDTEIGDYLK